MKNYVDLYKKIINYCKTSEEISPIQYNIKLVYLCGKLNLCINSEYNRKDNLEFGLICSEREANEIINSIRSQFIEDHKGRLGQAGTLSSLLLDEYNWLASICSRNTYPFDSTKAKTHRFHNSSYVLTIVYPEGIPTEVKEFQAELMKNSFVFNDLSENDYSFNPEAKKDVLVSFSELFVTILNFIESKANRINNYYNIDVCYYENNVILDINSKKDIDSKEKSSDKVHIEFPCDELDAKLLMDAIRTNFINRHKDGTIIPKGYTVDYNQRVIQSFQNNNFMLNLRLVNGLDLEAVKAQDELLGRTKSLNK